MQHHLIGMIFPKVVFMAQGKREKLSAEQRTDMWRRWKAGESLHEIGRVFGKGHGSIRFLLTQRGGIVPAARRRSPRTLTLAERKTSHEELHPVGRFGRSLKGYSGLCRQ